MGITKGYTFGATELVTNTKLHTLVDSATLSQATASAIGGTLPSTGAFTSISATAINLTPIPTTSACAGVYTPFNCNRFFNLSLNGVVYYVPCASASS